MPFKAYFFFARMVHGCSVYVSAESTLTDVKCTQLKQKEISASLKFIGAAQVVTGSKTLLTVQKQKYLIDCGLYQGAKYLRLKNWDPVEEAEEIDAVILTHAHVDHSGYLPKLVKDGYKGPIYCSQATYDLCKILLHDAAHLLKEDAILAQTRSYDKYNRPTPLYSSEDVNRCLELFRTIPDQTWIELDPFCSLQFIRSGHILGSRFVQFDIHGDYKRKILTFSGDIGSGHSLILKDPLTIHESDIVVMESTYGDRNHKNNGPDKQLKTLIKKVKNNSGVLVIPAFSVGRTQEILFLISKLKKEGAIPPIDIYLDSPMSISSTAIYQTYSDELTFEITPDSLCSPLDDVDFIAVKKMTDSAALCKREGPFIVLSASGMLSGGRIIHHLKARLPHSENIILFSGFQPEETKGRLLQDGVKSLKIHGEEVPVHASIVTLETMSAHADQQGILKWLGEIKNLKIVLLNHGEEKSIAALQKAIKEKMDVSCQIPHENDVIDLFS